MNLYSVARLARPSVDAERQGDASRIQSQTVTARERTPWWTLPPLPSAWVVAAVLAVTLLGSLGASTVLVQSREATIAAQAGVLRQQADTVGHYQQTSEALLLTAQQYAGRLLVLSEVAELDRAIIAAYGHQHAQHLAVEQALQVGGETYAEAAMVEEMLQRHLDRLQAQRQVVLAQEATGMTAPNSSVSDHPSALVGPQPLGSPSTAPIVAVPATDPQRSLTGPQPLGSPTTQPSALPSVRDMQRDLTGPLPVTE